MMNNFYYIFFFLLFFSRPAEAQNPASFPLYHEVVEHFMRHTKPSIQLRSNLSKIVFEKKSDGYWVGITDYQDDKTRWKTQELHLFWSLKDGYQSFKFKDEDESSSFKEEMLLTIPNREFNYDKYNIHRFFGYDNWEEDVINFYQMKNRQMEVMDYYSLARAYSNKSLTILSDNKKLLEKVDDPIAIQVVEKFTEQSNAAIHFFLEAHQKDPNFATLVGSIYTKYCNEILTQFMNLAIFSTKDKALACLKDQDLYSESVLQFSKNMLRSCPKDAMFYTYGDNDTYPLLYLQYAHNFRPDVLIVNTSLLNTDYYTNHLRDKNFYANPYPLQVDKAIYEAENNNFILIEDSHEETAIAAFKKALKKESPTTPQGKELPRACPSKQLTFVGPNQEPVTLALSGRYLYKGDIITLLMLADNQGKRPLCFSPSFAFSKNPIVRRTGLYDYMHQVGFCHQFKFGLSTKNPLTNIDSDENYKLFTETYAWSPFETVEEANLSSFHAYKYATSILIKKLIDKAEKEKAATVLDLYFKNFPLENIPLNPRDILVFADINLELNRRKEAKIILSTHIEQLLPLDTLSREEKQSIVYIEQMLDKYNINDFDSQLKKINEKPTEKRR